jgi:hypothetical protein
MSAVRAQICPVARRTSGTGQEIAIQWFLVFRLTNRPEGVCKAAITSSTAHVSNAEHSRHAEEWRACRVSPTRHAAGGGQFLELACGPSEFSDTAIRPALQTAHHAILTAWTRQIDPEGSCRNHRVKERESLCMTLMRPWISGLPVADSAPYRERLNGRPHACHAG